VRRWHNLLRDADPRRRADTFGIEQVRGSFSIISCGEVWTKIRATMRQEGGFLTILRLAIINCFRMTPGGLRIFGPDSREVFLRPQRLTGIDARRFIW
jgi:hypothetical protein